MWCTHCDSTTFFCGLLHPNIDINNSETDCDDADDNGRDYDYDDDTIVKDGACDVVELWSCFQARSIYPSKAIRMHLEMWTTSSFQIYCADQCILQPI